MKATVMHEQRYAPEFDDDEIDLRDYWRVVWGRKWSIIGLALAITLLTAMVVFSLEPVYRATATVMIESNKAKVVSIEEIYGIESPNREFFQTQFEILKSRALVDRLVRELALAEHPEYDPERHPPLFDWKRWIPSGLLPEEPPPTPEHQHDALVEAVMGSLTIEPVRNSQLAHISFEAHDAELASQVANKLAEVYILSDLEARLGMTQQATGWLTGRLENLRQNLEKSEHALQQYRDQTNLVEVGGVRTTAANQLDETANRLSEARKVRANAESLMAQVKELRGAPLERLETIPAVLQHPLVQKFNEAEADAEQAVSELSRRYGPKHPKMRAALSALETARQSLRSQIGKVIDGIEKDYQVAVANERAQQLEYTKLRDELKEINRKEQQLRIFERDVASNRELYNMFLGRSKETGISSELQTPIARVVDPAVVPYEAYKPKKKLILAIALVLGGLFGVLLAFLLDYLDNTFKTTEDVERRVGLSVLGILPLVKRKGRDALGPIRTFKDDPKGGFAESVRTIRTGVMLSGLDNPHKIIVVTSSVPGEGKSTLSINLAIALGHMERVLLIDADMRRPSIARSFGIEESRPGLSALVVGTSQPSECILTETGEQNLHVLGSGAIPPNPLELLSSKRFAAVIRKLTEHYDRIVIDSAPTEAVSDALVLSRLASAVVYVVKADATPYHLVEDGIKRLRQFEAPLLGVVLNQVDVRKASRYYGKYGAYHGGYYGAYDYQSK